MKVRFDDCIVDDDTRMLSVAGEVRHVEPKVLDTLIFLLENRHGVVSKEMLIDHIWNGRIVSEAAISTVIAAARRAVGDDGTSQRLIKTVHGRGFRFVGVIADDEPSHSPPPKSPDTVTDDKPTLVVLPFDNISGNASETYFADGVGEDLTAALLRVRWLFIISYRSSVTHRGTHLTPSQIALDLGVRYVVHGSIRRAGERLRMTCSLTDTTADLLLWSDRFDGNVTDVLEFQDQICGQVATKLTSEITVAEVSRARRKPPRDIDAWDRYLRALPYMHALSQRDNDVAKAELMAALEIDPDLPLAHAALAWCHVHDAVHAWRKPGQASIETAIHHASEAVTRDPADPYAQCAAAIAQFWAGDLAKALDIADHAIELAPNLADAQGIRGNVLSISGRPEEALAALVMACRSSPRDPANWFWTHGMANAEFALGNYAEAYRIAEQTARARPGWAFSHLIAAASAAMMNDTKRAEASRDKLVKAVPGYSLTRLKRRPMWTQPEDIERLVSALRRAGVAE